MNKSLDAIKGEYFAKGFSACQSVTIDRCDVKLLVEALKNVDGYFHKNWAHDSSEIETTLEAFYKKYPDMKEE